ncbi:hypothetical protein SSX86_021311 [Deinandra increscens subsp. villosa]|uniref:TRAF-type domain-containing protein n=1 Tax=Deinandra increscens subsp. villosa TaxID=3103831 RepID=A0AAP0CUE5_9ASTR
MDPPQAAGVETKSEKTEQSKSFDCGLCDTEVVYKIAQELLPGLASSCVDNTTGGFFTSAGTVAVDMRKEMTDYLTRRSETYVAEFLLSENASMLELSEHPYDIILNLIDDFASSKTNMLSRVSELVLSDRREDRIDDFVQEMEINGFWLLAPRECVASLLVKNVDYKNSFHCNTVCSSEEEVVKHRSECMFRPMDCTNEGCTTRYCVAQKEHHEAVCPFMVLPCEQKCSDFVMRREMDRHCVTVCPMKLVNCAFYTVGCASSIPRCNVQKHNADELSSHLLYIIRTAHKEASDEALKHRVEQIRNLSNVDRLVRARDTRALTYLIKDAEGKLGPLDVKTTPHEGSNKKESPTKTEPPVVKDGANSPKKNEDHQGTPSATDMTSSTEKPVKTEDDTKLPTKGETSVVKDGADSPKKQEEHQGSESAVDTRPSTEKPVITEDDTKLPAKQVHPELSISTDPPVKIEGNKDKDEPSSATMKEQHEHFESPMSNEEDIKDSAVKEHTPKGEKAKDESSEVVIEKTKQSSIRDEEDIKKSFDDEKIKQSASNNEEDTKKSPGKETVKESAKIDEELKTPTANETIKESSHRRDGSQDSFVSVEEDSMKSPSETYHDS